MMVLVIAGGLVAFLVAVVLLARASGPTRSVSHVLHDTEHPTGKL